MRYSCSFFYQLLLVGSFFLIAGIASADNKENFLETMNSSIAFSSMFADGQTQATQKEYVTAERHLSTAIKYADRLSEDDLVNMFNQAFANEFLKFKIALGYRLEGWQNSDRQVSLLGIQGMERFRNYYNKNREWITSKLYSSQKKTSWITWNPKEGELLPRIGCEKGAFIAWVAGC
jgi:hypothetical protein